MMVISRVFLKKYETSSGGMSPKRFSKTGRPPCSCGSLHSIGMTLILRVMQLAVFNLWYWQFIYKKLTAAKRPVFCHSHVLISDTKPSHTQGLNVRYLRQPLFLLSVLSTPGFLHADCVFLAFTFSVSF